MSELPNNYNGPPVPEDMSSKAREHFIQYYMENEAAKDQNVNPDDPATRKRLIMSAEVAFEEKVRQKLLDRHVGHVVDKRFKEYLAAEETELPPVEFYTLEEQLAAPEVPQEYLIEGLMIRGGNTLLAAQKKSGKSTLMMNLMKSLCDGTPFLDYFPVKAPKGRVAWWDYELDRDYATNQLRQLGIKNPARASTEHLRGYSTPLIDPAVQDWAVEWLTTRQVDVWIIDPFGAVFTGEENSNDDVREWHKAVDLIKRRAGVSEVIVVTHTGHAEVEEGFERTRGASRLGDWADNTWSWSGSNMTNEKEGNPKTHRWLIAQQSRGVEDQKWTIDCDISTWTLSVVGAGGRVQAAANRIRDGILKYVSSQPEPVSTNEIKEAVTGKGDTIGKEIKALTDDGVLILHKDLKGRGNWYSVPDIARAIPSIPTNSPDVGPPR